jgi:hypothetical protein
MNHDKILFDGSSNQRRGKNLLLDGNVSSCEPDGGTQIFFVTYAVFLLNTVFNFSMFLLLLRLLKEWRAKILALLTKTIGFFNTISENR